MHLMLSQRNCRVKASRLSPASPQNLREVAGVSGSFSWGNPLGGDFKLKLDLGPSHGARRWEEVFL
jgi:hypothetical protein